MTSLGIPSVKGWYARNPWSMVWFSGKLFIGQGNASNRPAPNSSPNAGPCEVWAWNGTSWVNDFSVSEEQIDRLVIIDGNLIIPGTDSHVGTYESWYTRTPAGVWTTSQNFTNALHCFDIKKFGSLYFAGLGVSAPWQAGAWSSDSGANWTRGQLPYDGFTDMSGSWSGTRKSAAVRGYRLFEVGGELYINTTSTNTYLTNSSNPVGTYNHVSKWDGTQWVSSLNSYFSLSVDFDRIVCPVILDTKTVYILAASHNDEQWVPSSVYWVDANLVPHVVTIPQCDQPQDLLVIDGRLYVLANQTLSEGFRVSIQTTTDLTNWFDVYVTYRDAFGRALAHDGTNFYIGYGGDTTAYGLAQNETGTIDVITPARSSHYATP